MSNERTTGMGAALAFALFLITLGFVFGLGLGAIWWK
jgi:hypothetical protein